MAATGDGGPLARVADALRGDGVRVLALTGAGVSAPSGVPTFRGPGGLWRGRRPEELASPDAFAADPRLVWEWYDERRAHVARCRPNAAHEVLARWSRRLPGFRLVTQNVDGLHERAGTAGVLRFHGSLWEVLCTGGCAERRPELRVPLPELPPRCERCGGLLRPGVVWFGEPIDPQVLERSVSAAASCDVALVAGTSAVVHPAASLLDVAAEAGAFLVEINPERTAASARVDVALQGSADEVLPAIDARLQR